MDITVSILLVIGTAKKSTSTMMLPALAWIIIEIAAGINISFDHATHDIFSLKKRSKML
jgi:hypothetical protein